jgi:hypothetical protein
MEPKAFRLDIIKKAKRVTLFLSSFTTILLFFNYCDPGVNDTSINVKVHGHVIDRTTGKAIPFSAIEKTINNNDTFTIGSLTTDSVGNFTFNYDYYYDLKEVQFVIAHANKYFNGTPQPVGWINGDVDVTIPLVPKSNLFIHFITSSQNDTVIFKATILQNTYPGTWINISYSDTVFQSKILKRAIDGNIMNHFSWIIKKNGISQTFRDSIKLNAFDSANYSIVF